MISDDRLTLDEYFEQLTKTRLERQLTPAEKAKLQEIVRQRENLPGGERLIDSVYISPASLRLQ